MKVQNVLPPLPDGCNVGEKPVGIEFTTRMKSKWLPIIETLKVLDNTKDIQMSVQGINKMKLTSMKAAIRKTGKDLNFKGIIKFAVDRDIMHIWSNK